MELVEELKLGKQQYQYGLTKLFLKAGQARDEYRITYLKKVAVKPDGVASDRSARATAIREIE